VRGLESTEFDIDYIKRMYDKFKSTNEENIKIHVVSKFLEMLGYDSSEFYYEHSMFHKEGRADIAVKVDEITHLYVEVKSPESKLNEKEQNQLARYLHSRGLSWGILTNGKKYILFNDSIKPVPNPNRPVNIDKVVFVIDVFNNKQYDLISYLRKENIFENNITNYFRDIAQFKAIKFPEGGSSWNQYKGTLHNFFKYYSKSQKRYRDLNTIRIDEFEDFLKDEMNRINQKENGKKINSISTFKNKYSHIRAFYQMLKVKNSEFEEEKSKLINKINAQNKNINVEDILNEENIKLILDFYDRRQDANRNKTIFMLCICFGLKRSVILSLSNASIKGDKLYINERELTIPTKILKLIRELQEDNKQKKVKGNYLFYRNYNKQYSPITGGIVNNILDNLKELNEAWSVLSPKNIRNYLIKKLFDNNYSIEEIIYLTGADLKSIDSLIPYDEIIKKVKTEKQKGDKVHPFHDFLY
jgi:integrase/recombinase XerD